MQIHCTFERHSGRKFCKSVGRRIDKPQKGRYNNIVINNSVIEV